MPPVRRSRRSGSIGARMSRRMAGRRKTTRSRSRRGTRRSRVVRAPKGKTYSKKRRAYSASQSRPASASRYYPGTSYAYTSSNDWRGIARRAAARAYWSGPSSRTPEAKPPADKTEEGWASWTMDKITQLAGSGLTGYALKGAVWALTWVAKNYGDEAEKWVKKTISEYWGDYQNSYSAGSTDVAWDPKAIPLDALGPTDPGQRAIWLENRKRQRDKIVAEHLERFRRATPHDTTKTEDQRLADLNVTLQGFGLMVEKNPHSDQYILGKHCGLSICPQGSVGATPDDLAQYAIFKRGTASNPIVVE